MGFIIHKYFLSKGLKAPPPSGEKKKKKSSKTDRRYSQPASGSDFLAVPESAYASNNNNSISNLGSLATPSSNRRRRTSTFRRASMPASSVISEGNNEDSVNSFGANLSFVKQHSFRRRASLQPASAYVKDENEYYGGMNPDNDNMAAYENSFSGYYQPDDTQQELPYGDWEQSAPTRSRRDNYAAQRRASMSSETSSVGNNSDSGVPSSRLRQENRWLQMQLKQTQRHCAQLEAKLYGARDQLAYTNASWLDQLYDAQSKHQQVVFQTQRQAEKASNAILEQELEELRNTLTRVAEEEAKLTDKKRHILGVSSMGQGENDDGGEYDVLKLQAELKEWKDRHAQTTANAKRIQDILEQEAIERNTLLQESERRVVWLEEELQAILPEVGEDDDDDDDLPEEGDDSPVTPRHVALLYRHQSQLEDRVQGLLLENAQLQRGQSQSYELQAKVKQLEGALAESKEQQERHQTWHVRQVDHWKEQAAKWQAKADNLERRLTQQVTTREGIRAEYASRLEALETENCHLRDQLAKKQDQWRHQSNLKERTIADLRAEIAQIGRMPTRDVAAPAAPAATLEPERVVEEIPTTMQSKNYNSTVASEDTVFDGASSSSSIPEGPIPEGHGMAVMASSESAAATSTTIKPLEQTSRSKEEESEVLQRAQQREKKLLLQISRLVESEAAAKERAKAASERINVLESYLDQGSKPSGLSDEGDETAARRLQVRRSMPAADDKAIRKLLEDLC